MYDSWKLSLPCTKAVAERIATDDFELDAVLLTTEEDEAADRWRLDAYFEGEPTAAQVATIVGLVPGAGPPALEQLPDEDWVTLSQAGLEPIREGRFVVHTAAFPADPPPGGRAFRIEASQAFGTGHHETTSGCLALLDRLADEGRVFANIVDFGTGTGLLAFAARVLWPDAAVLATDIDPVAIKVTRENAAVNEVAQVALEVAAGADGPVTQARAPIDLIVANILAGPLIELAPDFARVAAPGATIVLAGLLTTQAEAVVVAYEAEGARAVSRDVRGDWTILRLET